jgi:hypothetical protein
MIPPKSTVTKLNTKETEKSPTLPNSQNANTMQLVINKSDNTNFLFFRYEKKILIRSIESEKNAK